MSSRQDQDRSYESMQGGWLASNGLNRLGDGFFNAAASIAGGSRYGEFDQFNRTSMAFPTQPSPSTDAINRVFNIVAQADSDMLIRSGNAAYASTLQEHNGTKLELESLKRAFEALIKSSHGSTSEDKTTTATTAGRPSNLPKRLPYRKEDYPKVKFWTREDYDKVKGKKSMDVIRDTDAAAAGLPFVETADGIPITEAEAVKIRKTARGIFAQFLCDGTAPAKWGQISVISQDFFFNAIAERHPTVAMCEDMWKAQQVATLCYPSWHRNNKEKIRAKREELLSKQQRFEHSRQLKEELVELNDEAEYGVGFKRARTHMDSKNTEPPRPTKKAKSFAFGSVEGRMSTNAPLVNNKRQVSIISPSPVTAPSRPPFLSSAEQLGDFVPKPFSTTTSDIVVPSESPRSTPENAEDLFSTTVFGASRSSEDSSATSIDTLLDDSSSYVTAQQTNRTASSYDTAYETAVSRNACNIILPHELSASTLPAPSSAEVPAPNLALQPSTDQHSHDAVDGAATAPVPGVHPQTSSPDYSDSLIADDDSLFGLQEEQFGSQFSPPLATEDPLNGVQYGTQEDHFPPGPPMAQHTLTDANPIVSVEQTVTEPPSVSSNPTDSIGEELLLAIGHVDQRGRQRPIPRDRPAAPMNPDELFDRGRERGVKNPLKDLMQARIPSTNVTDTLESRYGKESPDLDADKENAGRKGRGRPAVKDMDPDQPIKPTNTSCTPRNLWALEYKEKHRGYPTERMWRELDKAEVERLEALSREKKAVRSKAKAVARAAVADAAA